MPGLAMFPDRLLVNDWKAAHAQNAATIDQLALYDSVGNLAGSLGAVVADVVKASPIARGLVDTLGLQPALLAVALDTAALAQAVKSGNQDGFTTARLHRAHEGAVDGRDKPCPRALDPGTAMTGTFNPVGDRY